MIKKHLLKLFFFGASLLPFTPLFAQSEAVDSTQKKTVLHIRAIRIEGNKRTKEYVLRREMSLTEGDTLHLTSLMKRMKRDEELLMNTSLFNWAKINVQNWQHDTIDLSVKVDEAMYFYAVPFAELADRNFDEWWNRQGRALWRINWQLKLTHYNLTGNNDRLTGNFQLGYSQKAQVSYRTAYLDKNQTVRATLSAFYARNREVQTITRESRQVFLRNDEDYPLQRWRANVEFAYRPRQNYTLTHSLTASYFNHVITAAVRDSNAAFFNGELAQRFASLAYTLADDTRDVRPYPYKGHSFWAALSYDGLIADNGSPKQITLESSFFQYFHTGNRLSYELGARAFATLWADRRVPYYNIDGLGYTNAYLRGYDGYVQDGQNWVLTKASIRYKVLDFVYDFGKMMPISQIRKMPTRAYFTLSSDAGYVQDRYYTNRNPFVNRWLYGGGPGIDIRIYFENTFSMEYLINHLGERNLFVRIKTAF